MKINCEQCGKKFWKLTPKQRFCGASCGATHSAEVARIKKKANIHMGEVLTKT
jgi:hypothetical protein